MKEAKKAEMEAWLATEIEVSSNVDFSLAVHSLLFHLSVSRRLIPIGAG